MTKITFYIKKYLKKPWFWVVVLGLMLLIFWWLRSDQDLSVETEIVALSNVQEMINSSVRLSASEELELAFEVAGTVSELEVDEGDSVTAGQILARLNTALFSSEVSQARAGVLAQEAKLQELLSGLTDEARRSAEAKLNSAQLTLDNARAGLQDIIDRHDRLVADARQDLLGSNLSARLVSSENPGSFSYQPPEISGNFTGESPGEYRLTLFRSGSPSGYSFRATSNIDATVVGSVSVDTPQPLGSLGLFIRFPDNFAREASIEWLIEIPNPNAASYNTLKQALERAEETRDISVREAERRLTEAEATLAVAQSEFEAVTSATRSEQIASQEAVVDQARSALQGAETRLSKTTLRSPISAEIGRRHISVGQTVSPGLPVFSLTDSGIPHLTAFIPEVDIANLTVGDRAVARMDAFPNERFEAEVVFVSPTAIERDGVASFKVRLDLSELDPRLRVGMTGSVDIFTASREAVINLPGRAVFRQDDQNFVRVVVGDREYRRQPVELGLRGSTGRVEIVSGLKEGERVIVFAREADLVGWQEVSEL